MKYLLKASIIQEKFSKLLYINFCLITSQDYTKLNPEKFFANVETRSIQIFYKHDDFNCTNVQKSYKTMNDYSINNINILFNATLLFRCTIV